MIANATAIASAWLVLVIATPVTTNEYVEGDSYVLIDGRRCVRRASASRP